MPNVKIKRLGATKNRKPLGAVGEVVEVSDRLATALVTFGNAVRVDDKGNEVKPDPEKENATDPNADNRETREA